MMLRALQTRLRRHGPEGDLFSGIGRRLVIRVLLFSSTVTLILTVSQLYFDYSRDLSDINARLDEIGRSNLESIGRALWSIDEGQLALQLQGILRLPHIRAAEVHETTGTQKPLTITAGERGTGAVVAREFPIFHEFRGGDQPIGYLYVEATLTEVYRSLFNKALFILVGQGAKTFLVTFFIVYIFYRLVTRHLADIAGFLGGYAFGQPRQALRLRRRPPSKPDELDLVVDAFNSMFASLDGAYNQLREANAQLELDVAARRRAEAALRDYAETASDWFWETGPDHAFTYISDEVAAFGLSRGATIGAHRWDFAADLDSEAEKWRAHRATLERHEAFRNFVYSRHAKDGTLHYMSTSGKPMFAEDGRFLGYRGTATDVTARSLAEARIRELSLAVEQSPSGIAIVDLSGRLIYSNPTFRHIVRLRGEGSTVAICDMLPSESWQRLSAVARRGDVGREELTAQRLSEETFWAIVSVAGIRSASGDVGRLVVALEDITREKAAQQERERLQERLQQSSKIEAIGRLAGGIAHDFNNLLGALMGLAQFLIEDLTEAGESRKHAERILKITERGRNLVEQLLAFARAGDTERHILDITSVLEGNRDLLETWLPSSATFVFEAGTHPLMVRANEGQLQQVLLNLCINARDALGGKPGTIAIRLARVQPDSGACRAVERFGTGQLKPGRDYARITVSDSGSGMDAKTLTRIFEPFYTTKEVGRGTGLGLAVVHGIVTSYDGAISVESTPGSGTSFVIYLPIEEGKPIAPVKSAAEQQEVHGQERVFVVDDDPDLVQVLETGLRRLGYEVTSWTDPTKALQAFEAAPERWDVVVSDQTMPGMTGVTLIGKLKERRPDLLAVLYTGFDERVTENAAPGLGIDALLQKPIRTRQLAAEIRNLLDARPRAT